jgi:hypothetical protein
MQFTAPSAVHLNRGRVVRTLLCGFLALAALPGVASATHNPNNLGSPPRDLALGHGTVPCCSVGFNFAAQSGPLGEHPAGHVQVEVHGDRAGNKVECLAVAGNRAAVGAERPDVPGLGFYIVAEDNDSLISGAPDRANAFFSTGPPTSPPTQAACNLMLSATLIFPVDGEIVVHDATP